MREQALASEAIDRALRQVEWPDVAHRSVFVDIGSLSGEDERRYLRGALDAALVSRGAKIARDEKSADYTLLVLAKAVGVDESQTFFGVPAMQTPFLPIGLPEIPLYKASHAHGVAEFEGIVTDRRRGRIVAVSPLVLGETKSDERAVLFIRTRDSDTKTLD